MSDEKIRFNKIKKRIRGIEDTINDLRSEIKEKEIEVETFKTSNKNISDYIIIRKDIVNAKIMYPLLEIFLEKNMDNEFNELLSLINKEIYNDFTEEEIEKILKMIESYICKFSNRNKYSLKCVEEFISLINREEIKKHSKLIYKGVISKNSVLINIDKDLIFKVFSDFYEIGEVEICMNFAKLIIKEKLHIGYEFEEGNPLLDIEKRVKI